MTEYVFGNVQKSSKAVYPFIIIAIAAIILMFLFFSQFIQFFPSETLSMEQCADESNTWCETCFFDNSNQFNSWNVSGSSVGEALAECSVKFYNSSMSAEQDCSGGIDFCLMILHINNYRRVF
jgi:hypothetical protein